MLQRVELTPEQTTRFLAVLEENDEKTLKTELSTNINRREGFLATRFLPLPPIQAHGRVEGNERDWAVGLYRGVDGYVVLQQLLREGSQRFPKGTSVEAHFVIRSNLDFAWEDRQTGWAMRSRRLTMDVVEWTLEQGRSMTPGAKARHRLWQEVEDPNSLLDFFGSALVKIRKVLAGKATVHDCWGGWAADSAEAEQDWQACVGADQILERLLVASKSPRVGGV